MSAIHEALTLHAVDKLALRFIGSGMNQIDEINYGELNTRMRSFGSQLIARDLSNKRVVIACASSIDYVVALLGCFFAGAIAVPYMPVKHRMHRSFGRLMINSGADAVIVDSEKESAALRSTLSDIGLASVAVYDLSAGVSSASGFCSSAAHPDSIAYIQYTSGSTSRPKGVLVTHANVLANVSMICDAFSQDETSTWLGWLPLYHDMGLVSGILLPLIRGIPGTFMAPMDFFQNPLLWIRSISRFHATTSGGPNFSFDLCTRAHEPAQLEGVDLSGWSVAFNGAEAVSRRTMENFAQTFEPYGFNYSAFKPCYGLAETTLVVSAVRHDGTIHSSTGPDGKERVCVGAPAHSAQVLLRDDTNGTLYSDQRKIGEICVSGPSVTRGYWGEQDGTSPFQLHLNKLFLRTGDLGYFDNDELVICGRLKELIVIRGRNFYPHDIEHELVELEGIIACAAFSIDGADNEEVVLAIEVHRHTKGDALESIAELARRHIRDRLDLSIDHLVAIRERSIPRTTSGKVQRLALKERYLNRDLEVLFSRSVTEEPPTPHSNSPHGALADAVAEYIGRPLEPDDLERSLVDLGFDSQGLVRLSATLRKSAGVSLPPRLLHQATPLLELQNFFRYSLVSAAPSKEQYSLSQGQRALLLLQAAFPNSCRFTIARALSFSGCHDRKSLSVRLERLIKFIPMARARFIAASGPEHTVSFDHSPVLVEECFSDFNELKRWIVARCAHRMAPLSSEPLVEIALLWCDERPNVLIRAHHLVSDLTSIEMLLRSIAKVIARREFDGLIGRVPGRPSHRELFFDDQSHGSKSVLDRLLRKPMDYIDLCDGKNRQHLDLRRASRCISLPHELHRSLPALCRTYGTTEYVVLASIFLATISLWTGKKDVVVGTPIDTRETDEDFVAFDNYANLTLLRGLFFDGLSFANLILQIKEFVTALSEYRNVPFTHLVDLLQPTRKAGASPLFEILFTTYRSPSDGHAKLAFDADDESLEIEGQTARTISCNVPEAPFDLRFDVACTPTSLIANIEYRMAVAENYSITELAKLFIRLTKSLLIDADEPLNCGKREPSRIQGPTLDLSSRSIVHDITANCHKFRDSIAVTDEASHHSYGALLQRSADVSRRLIELGVQRDAAVAIYLPRGFDLIAAMLGVLRTGCCYVPISHLAPNSQVMRFRELSGATILIDTMFMMALRGSPTIAPHIDGQLAYRIFTSGSTGVPKCVEISQSSLRNLLLAMNMELKLSECDVFAVSTSISFDIAGLEIWLPLLTGSRMAIIQPHELLDGRLFGRLLERYKVSVLQGTPSLFSNLLNSGWHGRETLKILCGGERLDWTLARRLRSCGQALWNVYGPTETTIWSSAYKVEAAEFLMRSGSVPIGKPLSNSEFLVMDEQMNVVDSDNEGDLWIGGAGVANRYFADPTLTRERFLQPEDSSLNRRIYKTGDRAKLNRSGEFEFLGRLDRQVKVNGHRLELAEVETHLLTLANVRQAIALTSDGQNGALEIWAALVPAAIEETPPSDEVLRRKLREIAPDHAVPTRLLWLRDLPLNQNGKICTDSIRKAIRDKGPPQPGACFENSLEASIAESWREVLGVAVDNAEYSFFDYGGTSLQLTVVKQAIEKRTGMTIELLDLLHAGNINQLAARLQNSSLPVHKTRNAAEAKAAIRQRRKTQRRELE